MLYSACHSEYNTKFTTFYTPCVKIEFRITLGNFSYYLFFLSLVLSLLVHLMLIIYFPFLLFQYCFGLFFFSFPTSTSLATCFNRRVRCVCSIMSLCRPLKRSHLSSVSNLIKFTPKLNQFANKTLSVIFAMNENVLWSNTFSHSLFLCFA